MRTLKCQQIPGGRLPKLWEWTWGNVQRKWKNLRDKYVRLWKTKKKSLTTTKRGDQGGKKVPAFRLCSTLYKDSPQKSKSAISPAFSYWCCDAPWPTIQTPKNLDSFRAFWYAATTVSRVKPSFTQQSPLEIIMYVWAVVMLSLELIKHVLFSMQLALWSSFSHGRQPLHQKSNKGRRVSV